ncbi:GTP-binding protein [Curtanaerobium respiraculi]|uniref:GTP-binding protein n=1 Tax=Curtanaerobium respiraculi TaxID=2949669 RepID=UPI0024B3AE31|nr:GTP-binding protein [Curtanaerobium respiraculi]
MQFITVAGPPSSGKTSVILKAIDRLKAQGKRVGVVKFDCLSSLDDKTYERHDVPVVVGLAGNLCPDHFFIINIEQCIEWGEREGFDVLISESAGLCNRCSPHVRGILAICVIDNLAGINTPKKIGPMLRLADVVVVTKGDIVSQAEREVFYNHIHQVNPRARIVPANGITGQGSVQIANLMAAERDVETLLGEHLRFSMPSGLCSYCLGQTLISDTNSSGSVRRIDFGH